MFAIIYPDDGFDLLMSKLDNPKVILGITGGIAAYKSPEIVRRLRERGAEVQVVMTTSAEKLVSSTVFQAVSDRPVRSDLWDDEAEEAMGHIELARWADLIVVAPATANIMSQLAAGTASGLLTTLCLAAKAPLVLAPAMNQAMWQHPATQSNLQTLIQRGVRCVGPAEGEQACGDVGPGRMVEPAELVAGLFAEQFSALSGLCDGLNIVLTAGPTREPIDPVRYVSNRSSGKMGFAVAQAAAEAGARVTLIAGPVNLPTPPQVDRIDVETAAQMHEATMSRAPAADIYIGSAAISDYRPAEVRKQKIKKHDETLQLNMVKSADVLAEVAALRSGPFTVGFAAETERLEEHARGKMEKKKLNMIIGNLVCDDLCFDRDDNSVLVLWPGGSQEFARTPKTELAQRLIALIVKQYFEVTNAPTPIRRPAVS
jgi:phosphopantothenoylcysteine decarboxylase/phosphopantothenate--cysteine ligase